MSRSEKKQARSEITHHHRHYASLFLWTSLGTLIPVSLHADHRSGDVHQIHGASLYFGELLSRCGSRSLAPGTGIITDEIRRHISNISGENECQRRLLVSRTTRR